MSTMKFDTEETSFHIFFLFRTHRAEVPEELGGGERGVLAEGHLEEEHGGAEQQEHEEVHHDEDHAPVLQRQDRKLPQTVRA